VDEALPLAAKLIEQWNDFLKNKGESPAAPTDTNVDSSKSRTQTFEEFAKTPGIVDTFAALTEMFYWLPGRYSLRLELTTIHPNNKFIKNWESKLTEQDSSRLKLNILNVLREMCECQTRFPIILHTRNTRLGPNLRRSADHSQGLAANCGCQESNGDYPGPVFMISTEPRSLSPPLRTAWGPQSLPNLRRLKQRSRSGVAGKASNSA
jgi:hypothetical protein